MRWLSILFLLSTSTATAAPREFAHLWCNEAEREAAARVPLGGADPLVSVPPRWPLRESDRPIEGWVEVLLSVANDGSVRKACVVSARPIDWFEEEAVKAALKWRYRLRDVARLHDKRLRARFDFVIQ